MSDVPRCPNCRRAAFAYCDRLGRIVVYCGEAERLSRACAPVPCTYVEPPRKPRRASYVIPAAPKMDRSGKAHRRREQTRRYWLAKYGVAHLAVPHSFGKHGTPNEAAT
jgi:hypothetical protein